MALTFASVSGGRTPAARRRSAHTVASSGCCARRSSQYVTSSRSSAASLSRATGSVIGPTTGTTTNALPRRSARNGGRSVRRYFGLRGRSWGYLLEIGQEERTGLAAGAPSSSGSSLCPRFGYSDLVSPHVEDIALEPEALGSTLPRVAWPAQCC